MTNDAFRHKLMWCCTSRLTSAVAFLPANSFLSVLCASRVLVLENGKMAEFDSPSNLISQRGAFHKMAKDSGLVWSRGVSLCRASCCRELMFPMRGTQSYVPMTFFALKPAAVFIAQGGWAYLHKENITTSSLGSVCVALTKFIPHIKITTWISKPPHFYDGIKKLDLWVCLLYPHCPLLNSSTTCFHHHYHSSKHESFIQAVILELRHSLIVPVHACTLQEEKSLNVRNQECSSLTFGTGKDVGHAATKLIGQNHTSITEKMQTHSCCWCHWTVTSHSALTIYCLSVTAFRRAFAECVGGFIHVRNGSRAYFILIIKTKTVALSLVCSQICPALCLHSVFSGTAPLMDSETGQLWDVDKLFESTCCVSLEMYIPALHK